MNYNTKVLASNRENINYAAKLLLDGEIVGIPTETVYGLAAIATNPTAIEKIFIAKGRPQDNPLICHISDISMLEQYTINIPNVAYRLAEKFWPGALTLVLPKRDIIPYITSGGLDTVGIRFPSNIIAREIIAACKIPLAAPSANISGSPSPTTSNHVYDDMKGRIPLIIDGDSSAVGLESTVVSFVGEDIHLLRPGAISKEDLSSVGKVIMDRGILERIDNSTKVLSPGMKYKHYSPKANVIILNGSLEKFISYIGERDIEDSYSMIFNSDADNFPYKYLTYGDSSEEQAHNIFNVLREFDKMSAAVVYVRSPQREGVGLAVYNRLLRAAGFEVIEL